LVNGGNIKTLTALGDALIDISSGRDSTLLASKQIRVCKSMNLFTGLFSLYGLLFQEITSLPEED
jgi:hypothetical protein